jgi:hypothetical protein
MTLLLKPHQILCKDWHETDDCRVKCCTNERHLTSLYGLNRTVWSVRQITHSCLFNTMSAFRLTNQCGECLQLGAKQNGCKWADSGLSPSRRGSINSCRLGRSELLAVAANKAVITVGFLSFENGRSSIGETSLGSQYLLQVRGNRQIALPSHSGNWL